MPILCLLGTLAGLCARRLRAGPAQSYSKQLLDAWLRHSGVNEGRVSKAGKAQEGGVTANVVWYAVRRYAKRIGLDHLAPHNLRRTCARLCHEAGELE
jgi:integrase